ncbi:cyclophane-containing peptide 2OG-Fe(II) oxygenase YhhC [Pedobacter psychrodurus]|uniref:cyclophane-containing peptide 2OG-Fe(II) oxygenase YhhC n=1 Tax=Pedobacter psychrodurus TaxID=2530456 RepID=UPI00292FB817|nr:cyclophane-containing peptide 2OG-Fe(II) oxygenase YhhC [Pedobacter psychrodurus]
MSREYFVFGGVEPATGPFPHFGVSTVFKETSAGDILSWFKHTDRWHLTQTSFYTQYEFSLLDGKLPEEISWLMDETTVGNVKNIMEERFSVGELELVGLTAHKLINGHRMGVHNDFIGKNESHRLVIQLNEDWEQEKGGFLMLFNSRDPKDVAKIVQPLHNSAVGFEISQDSFHAVSTVHGFERYTLVYTFNEKL